MDFKVSMDHSNWSKFFIWVFWLSLVFLSLVFLLEHLWEINWGNRYLVGVLGAVALILSAFRWVVVPVKCVVPAEWFLGYATIKKSGFSLFLRYGILTPRKIKWGIKTKEKTNLQREVSAIDLRDTELNTVADVIHSDNGSTKVHCTLLYCVSNPKKAIYGLDNAPNVLDDFVQTEARNRAKSMSFDEFFTSNHADVSDEISEKLNLHFSSYGIKITSFQITSVVPTGKTKESIDKKLEAEKDKEARIIAAKARQRETEIDNKSVYLIAIREKISMEEAELVFQARMQKRAEFESAKKGGLVIASPGTNVSVSAERREDVPRGKAVLWEDDDDDYDEDDES